MSSLSPLSVNNSVSLPVVPAPETQQGAAMTTQETPKLTFSDLPNEIIARIFGNLNQNDLIKTNSASKFLRSHSQNETVRRINSERISLASLRINTESQLLHHLRSLGPFREKLTFLDLTGIKFTKSDTTSEIIKLIPFSLKELVAYDCRLDDDAVAAVCSQCPQLVKLNVSGNKSITGRSFNQLPASLKELLAEYCSLDFESNIVAVICARCPQLMKLTLSS